MSGNIKCQWMFMIVMVVQHLGVVGEAGSPYFGAGL